MKHFIFVLLVITSTTTPAQIGNNFGFGFGYGIAQYKLGSGKEIFTDEFTLSLFIRPGGMGMYVDYRPINFKEFKQDKYYADIFDLHFSIPIGDYLYSDHFTAYISPGWMLYRAKHPYPVQDPNGTFKGKFNLLATLCFFWDEFSVELYCRPIKQVLNLHYFEKIELGMSYGVLISIGTFSF